MEPLVDPNRPDWEIEFTDAQNVVLSVMPGESDKTFTDPMIGRTVKWEQDVYCPTGSVYKGRIYAVYRAYGDDDQWRMGLAWSTDGFHFERSEQPVFHARPEERFLEVARRDPSVSISYGDSRLFATEEGTYYLLFNFFQHQVVPDQELAVASTRDMKNWIVHGRIFQKVAERDREVIPEKLPWRFPHPAVVTRLEGDRLVATRINGRYWMYLNCLSTVGDCCLCAATSDNLIDWEIVRDEAGALVHPMPLRPGRFDSFYVDTTAAVLREDGILLLYNGINDDPANGGDPNLMRYAHYPAQALFDRENPARLLKRSETPFRGADENLEKLGSVFWHAPLYESWSLVPLKDELLLYWNHDFGRRTVGLWKAAIPNNIRQARPYINGVSKV
jgi:predicted GH43/DUF377 family glycosyl hydrolase